MSVKEYTSKWITTKIKTELYNEISSVVESEKKFGVEKYASVPDFIQQACIVLLEKIKKKEIPA